MVALRRLPSLWKAVSFWITMIPCASPTELAESPARSQAGAFHRFCSRGGRAQVAESVLQVSTGSLSRQDVVSATRQCIFCNSCLGRWILLVSPLHLLGRVGRAIRRVGSPGVLGVWQPAAVSWLWRLGRPAPHDSAGRRSDGRG